MMMPLAGRKQSEWDTELICEDDLFISICRFIMPLRKNKIMYVQSRWIFMRSLERYFGVYVLNCEAAVEKKYLNHDRVINDSQLQSKHYSIYNQENLTPHCLFCFSTRHTVQQGIFLYFIRRVHGKLLLPVIDGWSLWGYVLFSLRCLPHYWPFVRGINR